MSVVNKPNVIILKCLFDINRFNSIKIDYSDYPKSLISRINEGMFFQSNIAIAIFY